MTEDNTGQQDVVDQENELYEVAEIAIREGETLGADGTMVTGASGKSFYTRFANSAIHQNFIDLHRNLTIVIYVGKASAKATTNAFDENGIRKATQAAYKSAKVSPQDPDFPGLLDEPQEYPKLSLVDPTIKSISPDGVADKIVGAINAGHDFDKRVRTVSGNMNISDTLSLYKSSSGLEHLYPATTVLSTVNVMCSEQGEESRSNSTLGYRRISEIDLAQEAQTVSERAVLGLNAKDIEPKGYETLLDPQATADLMLFVGWALSAREVQDYQSFLRDRIGEQVFSEQFTVINDPFNPSLLGAVPLDAEGTSTQKIDLVDSGVIKSFAHSRVTAKKAGTESNGCSTELWGEPFELPMAMIAQNGSQSRESLISGIDNGLILTNIHYSNFINPPVGTLTGMTRDGLFVVENGELVGAARNMRFSDSLESILSQAIPSKEYSSPATFWGPSFQVPSFLVHELKFTSGT